MVLKTRAAFAGDSLSDSDFVDCGAWVVAECNIGMSPDKPPAPEHCGMNSSASKRELISGCVYLRYHMAPDPSPMASSSF